VVIDYFLSGYWQRAFSSKSDRDLWLGCTGAAIIVFVFLTLVGVTGLLAIWGGLVDDIENEGSYAFFLLLATMRPWVVCFVLIFTVSLSCAAYDTLQTALVATISECERVLAHASLIIHVGNDVFRNKISIWWVRLILIVNVPAIVVATKNVNILGLSALLSDLHSLTFSQYSILSRILSLQLSFRPSCLALSHRSPSSTGSMSSLVVSVDY
jgi:hypothetical protein